MQIVETIAELQQLADKQRLAGRRIALVPTMGALHRGHLSLVAAGRERADVVWLSIFVNPTQFDDSTDLERYPRTLDADLEACQAAGVDAVFLPDVREMVPDGSQTTVAVSELADSSVNLVVRPWCKGTEYWPTRWALTQALKEQLEAAGCNIPFPQRDVHLHKTGSEG